LLIANKSFRALSVKLKFTLSARVTGFDTLAFSRAKSMSTCTDSGIDRERGLSSLWEKAQDTPPWMITLPDVVIDDS
jgi:hypothetical protein